MLPDKLAENIEICYQCKILFNTIIVHVDHILDVMMHLIDGPFNTSQAWFEI